MCFEADKLHRWPSCGRQWNSAVSEQEWVEAAYKGTNEVSEGVEGLSACPLGSRAWRQRNAKHPQPFICWDQEALPLASLTPFWHVMHNANEPQRFSLIHEREIKEEKYKDEFEKRNFALALSFIPNLFIEIFIWIDMKAWVIIWIILRFYHKCFSEEFWDKTFFFFNWALCLNAPHFYFCDALQVYHHSTGTFSTALHQNWFWSTVEFNKVKLKLHAHFSWLLSLFRWRETTKTQHKNLVKRKG